MQIIGILGHLDHVTWILWYWQILSPAFFEKIRILVYPRGLLRRGTASINALFFDNSLKQLVFEECKWLVGGWTNPSEKYERQNLSISPNFWGENKANLSCDHLEIVSSYELSFIHVPSLYTA